MPKTKFPYYGGKASLLNKILPLIPDHKFYMEVFAGGASVLMAKEPVQNEILNDTNHFVVTFYEVVKTEFDWLKSKVEATMYSRVSHKVATTILLAPHLFSKRQIAWAFYISLVMSFSSILGGAWAIDKYAGKRKRTFLNKRLEFDETIVKRLENVEIESMDAVKLIEKRGVTEDMFIFCDPPYVVNQYKGEKLFVNQGHYKGYTIEDFKRLLDALAKTKAKFLLSSYPSELLDSYIQKYGWSSKSYDKPITASSASNRKRKRKIEVLTANYDINKVNK